MEEFFLLLAGTLFNGPCPQRSFIAHARVAMTDVFKQPLFKVERILVKH